MYKLLLCFLLLPFYLPAQNPKKELTNRVYNKIFDRQIELVSYQEIVDYGIKCIKYTSTEIDHTNIVIEEDSLGKRIYKRNLKTVYLYESFDSLGMLTSSSRRSCQNWTVPTTKVNYMPETIELLKNLEEGIVSVNINDSIVNYTLLFDDSTSTIRIYTSETLSTNIYLDFLAPEYIQLNNKFEIIKDSFYMKGVGCGDMNRGFYYNYNSKGQLLKMVGFGSSPYTFEYVYKNGCIAEIFLNDKPWAKYFYTNNRLEKIEFNQKYGLQRIEILY